MTQSMEEPQPSRSKERLRKLALVLIVSGGSLLADQITKHLAAKHLAEHAVALIENQRFALRFSLAHNPAGAWSLFGWAPGLPRRIMFVAVSVIASIALSIWYARTPRDLRLLRFGITFVLGGALGNLVDRALTGRVIDFVEMSLVWSGSRHFWPTYNVADIAICVGVGLLALDMFRPRKAQ